MDRKFIYLKYAFIFVIGLIIGFRSLPPAVLIGGFAVIAIYSLIQIANNNLVNFLGAIPFLCYIEIFMRAFFPNLFPYLGVQYFFLVIFILLLIKAPAFRSHSKAYFFMIAYVLVEFFGGAFTQNVALFRATMINSCCLLAIVIWASNNALTPVQINRLLDNIKYAGVMLVAIVTVAHLRNTISYGNASSYEASNGMAPVQLSGYLGFAAVVFFLSLMNQEDKKYRLINLGFLGYIVTIMLLTLSRGGLYFIAAVVVLYMYFNRAQFQNYFKLILILPIAFVIYNFVVKETDGAIIRRYGEQGASNRETLVAIGFKVFMDEPIFGVGTANYGWAIKNKNYFRVDSGAHNEFVRAAAEHGIIGIITYWGYFLYLGIEIMRRREPNRQYSVFFLALFSLISIHNGLKISVQLILMLLVVGNPSLMLRKKVTRIIQKKPIDAPQQLAY